MYKDTKSSWMTLGTVLDVARMQKRGTYTSEDDSQLQGEYETTTTTTTGFLFALSTYSFKHFEIHKRSKTLQKTQTVWSDFKIRNFSKERAAVKKYHPLKQSIPLYNQH